MNQKQWAKKRLEYGQQLLRQEQERQQAETQDRQIKMKEIMQEETKRRIAQTKELMDKIMVDKGRDFIDAKRAADRVVAAVAQRHLVFDFTNNRSFFEYA